MSGYVNFYQRIVRVSGGYSSRPFVGLASGLTWGERFRRDLDVLLDARPALDRYDREGGHTLLWRLPWSGEKDDAIPLEACDPYFIEVSRRVRLLPDGNGGITFRKGTNPGMRVEEPPDLGGVTGDAWTPITDERKALRIAGRGFHYRLLKEVLLGADYERPPALEFGRDEGGHMYLVAEALGRGQGKTYGLHRRIVPIPPEVTDRPSWRRGPLREELAERSRERIDAANKAKYDILRKALTTLFLIGRKEYGELSKSEKKKMGETLEKYLDALDRAIDAVFFESLWASAAEGVTAEEAQQQWQTLLWERADQQFEDAQGHAPSAAIHRWRARSAARSVFDRQANRYLKHADQARPATDAPDAPASTAPAS
jgi:CRISPR system Cascade subunit CasA